jgi:hypothetical protein
MNDTEREFNALVQEFGGTLVSDLVGKSPGFENADDIFDDYHLVAELKCLDEDKIIDPKFMEKVSSLYQEARQHGGTRVVVFGTVRVSSSDFTPEYQERLIKLYEEPIRNAVKKANRQIRETKRHFDKEDYDGLLLVINENNVALDPIHVVHLLDRIFSRHLYSSINHAISLTVSMRATHPSHNADYMTWTAISGAGAENEVFRQFQSALRESWRHYQEKKLGMHVPLLSVDDSFFRSLMNKRR